MKTNVNKIDRLKSFKEISNIDFAKGEQLFWLIKNILLTQEERINELEFQIAQLKGQVENDENI